MEFKYAWPTEPPKVPCAYIADDGSLVIRDSDGGDGCSYIAVIVCETGGAYPSDEFDPFNSANKRVFYPGDQVTITF